MADLKFRVEKNSIYNDFYEIKEPSNGGLVLFKKRTASWPSDGSKPRALVSDRFTFKRGSEDVTVHIQIGATPYPPPGPDNKPIQDFHSVLYDVKAIEFDIQKDIIKRISIEFTERRQLKWSLDINEHRYSIDTNGDGQADEDVTKDYIELIHDESDVQSRRNNDVNSDLDNASVFRIENPSINLKYGINYPIIIKLENTDLNLVTKKMKIGQVLFTKKENS